MGDEIVVAAPKPLRSNPQARGCPLACLAAGHARLVARLSLCRIIRWLTHPRRRAMLPRPPGHPVGGHPHLSSTANARLQRESREGWLLSPAAALPERRRSILGPGLVGPPSRGTARHSDALLKVD